MLIRLGVSLSLFLSISLSQRESSCLIVLITQSWPLSSSAGEYWKYWLWRALLFLLYPTSWFSPFRRRSTGCRWLSPSLLPSPRPPPLPAGGAAAPAHVPRTLLPRCWLRLLRRPPIRSLVPAAGSGVEGVREAEGEEAAEEDYGVCWSSLRTAIERRTSTGGERDEN